MVASRLFSSGFEGNVSLSPPADGEQQIVGTDSQTGDSWPVSFWNGSSAIQILNGALTNNQIQTVAGHDGTPTKALYQEISELQSDTGQDPLMFKPTNSLSEQTDLYTSEWIKFQPDLSMQLVPGQLNGHLGNWRVFWEWKTGSPGAADDGDYRITLSVNEDDNGNLYWSTKGDNNADSNLTSNTVFWSSDTHNVPVPAGEWFKLETFTHRSSGSDGLFWAKVNGQEIADHAGANIGVDGDPINRIMMAQDYSNGHMPAYQWVDDIEVWNGLPPAGSLASATAPATAFAPTAMPAGSEAPVLHVAEDAYKGIAHFIVPTEGDQVGSTQTATVLDAARFEFASGSGPETGIDVPEIQDNVGQPHLSQAGADVHDDIDYDHIIAQFHAQDFYFL